jgi:hypothetical protein
MPLGDVLFAPSLDDVARDVVAHRLLGGEDVANLDLAGLPPLLFGLLLRREGTLRFGLGSGGRLFIVTGGAVAGGKRGTCTNEEQRNREQTKPVSHAFPQA